MGGDGDRRASASIKRLLPTERGRAGERHRGNMTEREREREHHCPSAEVLKGERGVIEDGDRLQREREREREVTVFCVCVLIDYSPSSSFYCPCPLCCFQRYLLPL